MTKILIDEAVVRQALEWFDWLAEGDTIEAPIPAPTVRTSLRQALEQPVAQIDTSAERVEKEAGNKDVRPPNCGTGYCSCIECLFEQPAQEPDPDELTIAYMSGLHEGKKRKPWVGLTDEILDDIYYCVEGGVDALETWRQQARAIEAKLKEKNT